MKETSGSLEITSIGQLTIVAIMQIDENFESRILSPSSKVQRVALGVGTGSPNTDTREFEPVRRDNGLKRSILAIIEVLDPLGFKERDRGDVGTVER